MRHIEVHYVQTAKEALSLENLGLIQFELEEYCEHCGEPVAYLEEEFEPCGIVLDENYTYLLCSVCLLPVLNPGAELHY
jgi:hypothetical protein